MLMGMVTPNVVWGEDAVVRQPSLARSSWTWNVGNFSAQTTSGQRKILIHSGSFQGCIEQFALFALKSQEAKFLLCLDGGILLEVSVRLLRLLPQSEGLWAQVVQTGDPSGAFQSVRLLRCWKCFFLDHDIQYHCLWAIYGCIILCCQKGLDGHFKMGGFDALYIFYCWLAC